MGEASDALAAHLMPLSEIPTMPSATLRAVLDSLQPLLVTLQQEKDGGSGPLFKYAVRQRTAIEGEIDRRQAAERIMAMVHGGPLVGRRACGAGPGPELERRP